MQIVPQEGSRRLQLQSQVLQQRALEMSLRMSSSGSGRRGEGVAHTGIGVGDAVTPAPAVVALSQVTNLSAAMAGVPGAGNMQASYLQPQYGAPLSQANSVVLSDTDAFARRGDSLSPPDGILPRHPPGDVTPSSVTSSRAGLHWNIPSRGSIPSPGKVDPYGASLSRGDPR